MVEFVIPAVIIVVAIVAIIVVIARHMPQAASLDLESLPAEQEAAMRAALLERRLKRRMSETKNKIVPFFRAIGKAVASVFQRAHQRIAQLEQHYRRKPQLMSPAQQQEVKQNIQDLFAAASKAIESQDWAEAEKKYIEILGWDPKHPQAYLALAEMYLAKKEFAQAKETFQFFFKLIKAQKAGEEQISLFAAKVSDDEMQQAHVDYAQALHVVGDLSLAAQQMSAALKFDENNPKYLDKLLELSILIKERSKAREVFEKLKAVNPENQKLAEFDEQIRAL